jgi:predicted MFS family arabinose efflux permease
MVGTAAAEVALSVLVYQATGSVFLSAMVLVAAFLPQAFSATLLATVADRLPARTLLVGGNLLSALLAGVLALPGQPPVVSLLLAMALGAIVPVHNGVRSAVLADALPAPVYATARSLLRVITQSSLVCGFLIGGTLTSVIHPRAVLAANAASFVVAAALMRWGTDAPTRERTAGSGGPPPARAVGLRDILGSGPLRQLMLLSWIPPTFAVMSTGLTVGYAAQLGGDGTVAGMLFAAFAVGTVAGEVLCTRLAAHTRVRAVPALMLATQVPMVGFLATPPVPLAAALLLLGGSGFAYLQGLDMRLFRALDPDMRKRCLIVQSSGVMVCQGLGLAIGGVLADAFRPGSVIGASGIVGTVVCVVLLAVYRVRLPR